MDVSVRLPFRVDFDILEVENRFPSIQLAVRIEIRPSFTLLLEDAIWVEHVKWTTFVDELSSSSFSLLSDGHRELAFIDLSNVFFFGIRGHANGMELRTSWRPWKRDGHVSFEIVEKIDDDTFGHIQRAFAACPIR